MHFNIYLDDETASRLNEATQTSSDSRNAIIRKAIVSWLNMNKKKEWSPEVMNFKGETDFERFEANRSDLKFSNDDPLG